MFIIFKFSKTRLQNTEFFQKKKMRLGDLICTGIKVTAADRFPTNPRLLDRCFNP